MYEELTAQAKQAVTELLDIAKLKPGKLFVIGCSSSEMVGARIGKGSSLEAAQAAFAGIYPVLQERGIELAVQCCEHLNRALVVERDVAEAHGFEIVNAIPQLHAGGSFAMTAWANFKDPVLVETIVADAGLDIGGTLIGMHLRRVAIPVRLSIKRSARPTFSAPARARNTSAAPERFIRTCKHEKLLLPTARGAFDICRGLAKILGEFGCTFLWGFVGFPCFDTEFSFHHDGNVL